jgi:hypothetical protein
MGEFIFSFNSAVIVGSMFNVFSGSLVSFKVFKSYLKTLDNNLKKNHRKEMSRGMKALRKNYPKEY